MKQLILHFSFILLAFFATEASGHAQSPITSADRKKLKIKEDSLAIHSRNMAVEQEMADRMIADSIFIRTLVRSLQIKNSFYYPFDSVLGISKLYAPDSSFRIFSWNLNYDNYYSRQRGAIQMRTRDGSLKLFPLRDVSEFTENPMDSARDRNNWIGAVYYNIIRTQYNGKNYYTLFGFDGHTVRSSKKWLEVLSFNNRGEPVFGGPFFSFAQDSIPKPDQNRFSLEFKKDARVLLDYLQEENIILVDHLISENDEPDNPWTYVPDGDNEAFRWENGKWVHIDKAFTYKIDMSDADPYMGNPPVEKPILDSKGGKNEKKLQEQSEKNRQKEEQKPPGR